MSRKKPPFERSFASHPKSKYWSADNDIDPSDVSKSTRVKYKFDCNKCYHQFETSVGSITNNNTWCPFCANQKLCNNNECITCYNKSFASSKLALYFSSDNNVSTRDIFKSSGSKYKFDCGKCNHQFEKSLHSITSGRNCPFCAGQALCDNDKCKICYNKSFASHPRNIFWSSDNQMEPRYVTKGSNKQYIFDCDICDHQFKASIYNITKHNTWCSFCTNKNLCGKCDDCYNKSVAAMDYSKYWSKKNKLLPHQVFSGTDKKYIFDCHCNHSFTASPNNLSAGKWCPYCSNNILCTDASCKMCFKNSFASHKMAKYWSSSNIYKPRYLFRGSGIKCKFDCPHCKEIYEASLCEVTAGKWCTCVLNKTEIKLLKNLKPLYNNIIKQAKFNWCRSITNNRYLPFDFCIEKYKIIIELDGRQHFKQVQTWTNPQQTQEYDIYKMKCANKNGYSVIRILQEDVWNNKNNWKEELLKVIIKYPDPTNIFIGQTFRDLVDKSLSADYLSMFAINI